MAQLEHWERAGQVAEWHAAHPHAITAPGEWAPLTGSSEAGKSAGLATSARELSALRSYEGLGLVHAGYLDALVYSHLNPPELLGYRLVERLPY